jgi:hypothetical protein
MNERQFAMMLITVVVLAAVLILRRSQRLAIRRVTSATIGAIAGLAGYLATIGTGLAERKILSNPTDSCAKSHLPFKRRDVRLHVAILLLSSMAYGRTNVKTSSEASSTQTPAPEPTAICTAFGLASAGSGTVGKPNPPS